MKSLHIETVENGFVVSEGDARHHMVGRMWAFENHLSLATFIAERCKEMANKSTGETHED